MNSLQFKSFLQRLALFVVAIPFFSCAQSKSVVKKGYVFYAEHQPGNIAVDPKTHEPLSTGIDTATTIYVETATKLIVWDTAWQKGKCYLISATLVEQTPFEAGITKWENKKVILTPDKGNFLWQVGLQPVEGEQPGNKKILAGETILKGKYRGKVIIWKAANPVELAAIPSV
jgi:hypothetical protein